MLINRGSCLRAAKLPLVPNFAESKLLCIFYSFFTIMKFYFILFLFVCFPFIFISWRLITLQYCSGFCHTLTWISHGFTCISHPDSPSRLPPHPIPLGLPSAPAPSTCLMHPMYLLFDWVSPQFTLVSQDLQEGKLTRLVSAMPVHWANITELCR